MVSAKRDTKSIVYRLPIPGIADGKALKDATQQSTACLLTTSMPTCTVRGWTEGAELPELLKSLHHCGAVSQREAQWKGRVQHSKVHGAIAGSEKCCAADHPV